MYGLAHCVHFALKDTSFKLGRKRTAHFQSRHPNMPTEEIREFVPLPVITPSSQLPLEQRGWTCAFCDAGLPDGIPRSVKDFAIVQHYRTKHPRRDCSLAAVHKARAKRFQKNPAAEPKISESKKRLSTALSRFQNAAPANPKIAGHDLAVVRPHWKTWPSLKVKRTGERDAVTNRRKRRRRVLKPCRKIGKRRFCRKRRKHFRSFPYASFVLKCCISFFPFVLFFGGMAWAMSPKQRNKLQHSINGNGKGGKTGQGRNAPSSKGKGKASPQPVVVAAPIEDVTEDDIVTQIRQAQPPAALLRSQSELVQSEWSVSLSNTSRA